MNSWLTKIDEWTNRHRPTALLLTVTLTIGFALFVNWTTGSALFQQLFYPDRESVADVRFWSALVYATAFGMGLPVAFLLWHWRDRNVRDQIENARKDINLKEFQEVQLRAAGALDEKLPAEAREQLQIAALHQLRGFLRGDYGQSFKRPAFELLLAGHAATVHRIGVPEVQAQIAGKSSAEIKRAKKALRAKLTAIDRARMIIIYEEAQYIFNFDYSLNGRRFDLLNISRIKFPEKIQMAASHFFDSNLQKSDLSRASLSYAHLEGAFLFEANLMGTNLLGSFMNYGIECFGARFNEATEFGDWRNLTHAQKDAVRATWIERGMINVDAPIQ